ncbi:MAG: hypothetical protein WHF31_15295 [Candidatus Dehalobacter alkaniphilus]
MIDQSIKFQCPQAQPSAEPQPQPSAEQPVRKPMHKVIAYTQRTERIKNIIRDYAAENVEVIVIYNHPTSKGAQ